MLGTGGGVRRARISVRKATSALCQAIIAVIAASPDPYRPWPTKVTTLSSLSKWPYPASCALNWVTSSEKKRHAWKIRHDARAVARCLCTPLDRHSKDPSGRDAGVRLGLLATVLGIILYAAIGAGSISVR